MTTAETPVTPAQDAPLYTHRQIQLIMSGLMMGLLLAALDQTIVATALTRISQDFHRTDLYSWVVTSYLLTSTVTAPLYGKISDLFGRKRIFQFAIVVFLAGSALSGISQNMFQLIAFRGVQGLGAGGLMSLTLAILGDVIPPRDRGRYQGYFGAIMGVANVLGPLIGGFLVDQASWRWVFYVNLPIGAVALVVINRVLRLDHRPRKASIDVIGSVLIVGGVSLILIAAQNAGEQAKITAHSIALALLGLAIVGVFTWWETRAAEPILPLRMFRNSVFRICCALSIITGAVLFGAIIFLPQYLQFVRGVSPTLSGLRLLPFLAGLLGTSITSGLLISRGARYKPFVVVGTATAAVGVALLTQLNVSTTSWVFAAMLLVMGAGVGMFMQILVLATQNSIAQSDMGVGTSAITFFRTLGGAIGASALGAVLIAREHSRIGHYEAHYDAATAAKHAFTYGMDQAFLSAVPVAVIAFLVSLRLREVRLRRSLGSAAPADHGL